MPKYRKVPSETDREKEIKVQCKINFTLRVRVPWVNDKFDKVDDDD